MTIMSFFFKFISNKSHNRVLVYFEVVENNIYYKKYTIYLHTCKICFPK